MLVAVAAAALLGACGGTPAAVSGPSSSVEMRADDNRPRLGLVLRDGDPTAGVAVAIAHDLGASASSWLGAVLQLRLEAAGTRADVRPSGNALVLRTAAKTPKDVERAVTAAATALKTPFTEQDRLKARERFKAETPARPWASKADAAVSTCIGEAGDATPLLNPTLADVERFRRAVLSTRSIAFAVVGTRAQLDAAEDALKSTDGWPTHRVQEDPWPASDVVGFTRLGEGARTLSIAVRTADAAKAVVAGRSLGARGSALAAHLSSLDPAWSVQRASAAARPRGACVRVDLASTASVAPDAADVEGVAALALAELRLELDAAKEGAWALDQGALSASDPRDAAAIAAWRALTGVLDPGPDRAFVSAAARPGDAQTDEALTRGISRAEKTRGEPSVDVVRATEGGQGEQWMLLANPCATASESTRDAGRRALVVRTLAEKATGASDVQIEPWVSTSGIGLLAHAPRRGPEETPDAQAERIAGALGRALAGTTIHNDDTASARTRLLTELAPEIEPLWPAALDALSPSRASLLDARGTWQAVSDLSVESVEVDRHAFVRGPLRFALLLNATDTKPERATLSLERWLKPERKTQVRCPVPVTVTPKPGEYTVDAPKSPAPSSRALVGVTLPAGKPGPTPLEARVTAYLLNRPSGWLDTAVRLPGLALHAEASVLGGGEASALVVEVSAPDQKAKEAAQQVRALFARVAEGSATSAELDAAQRGLEAAELERASDPRHRVVRLWLAEPRTQPLDLATLRRFHKQALAPERHVLVVTRARP